jgi:hypothetical protein
MPHFAALPALSRSLTAVAPLRQIAFPQGLTISLWTV